MTGDRAGGLVAGSVQMREEKRARGRAQQHIRFDHRLEGSLALPICELVYEVARHTGRMAVEPEEAVVVAQSPGCP